MRTALQEFLDTHKVEEITSMYGVNYRRHPKYPNLVQFTYDQIESSSFRAHPVVRGCRGHILDESNKWAYVARPFDRFFNFGEGHADTVNFDNSAIYEKVDGSLCIVYFYDGKWHVATKGMPDAGGVVNGFSFSFADLFWKIAKEQNFHFKPPLVQSAAYTYLFELTSPYNKVVVAHKDSKLTYLGAIRNDDGFFSEPSLEVDFSVKSYDFNSMDALAEFASTLNGLEHEGFVVADYTDPFNVKRIKIKGASYLALAHMREGFGPRRVLEVVRTGEASEVQAYIKAFPEWAQLFNEVCDRYEGLVKGLEEAYAKVKDISVQKDFALAVQSIPCNSALFSMRSGRVTSIRKFLANMNVKSLMDYLHLKDIQLTFAE